MSYKHFTQETLAAADIVRQRSVELRSNLNVIYTNTVKDLRNQMTRVDIVLEEKVKLTQEVLQQLEQELLRVRRVNV